MCIRDRISSYSDYGIEDSEEDEKEVSLEDLKEQEDDSDESYDYEVDDDLEYFDEDESE